jgi:hypothetical protein
MRLPDTEYSNRPWRLHDIAPDFAIEDVWALPTPGARHDFDRLIRGFTGGGTDESGVVFRTLFAIRWWLGRRLHWDREDEGLDARVRSLRDRLPADLRDGVRGPDFETVPFVAVYQTDDEYVAELANRTVHALMHIGWVADETGDTYHAIMTALVRPNGSLGKAYMTVIRPIRRGLVYPDLIRSIGKEWPQYSGCSQ